MGGSNSKDMEHPSYDAGFLLLCKPEVHSKTHPNDNNRKVSGVNAMDVSDDGSLLATGGEDCIVRLWSTQACEEDPIGMLNGHKAYISCVTIYDDFVISGSNDKTIKKWSVLTENCVKTYSGHDGKVNKVICDGNHIFSSSDDSTIRMWLFDVSGNDDPLVRVFKGHHRAVFPITLVTNEAIQEFKSRTEEEEQEDPDADLGGVNALDTFKVQDLLISGSGDCTARVWSTQDGQTVRILKGHRGPIMCLHVDMNLMKACTSGGDAFVLVHCLVTGEVCMLRSHTQSVCTMYLVGSTLYTGSSDQTVRAWSLNQTTSEKMTAFRAYTGHEKGVGCIRAHNGYVYSGCGDGHTRMFHYSAEKPRRTFTPDNLSAVSCMEMTRGRDAKQTGAMLFTGTNDGSIYVWDISGVEEDNSFGMYITDKMCEKDVDSDDENISSAISQLN